MIYLRIVSSLFRGGEIVPSCFLALAAPVPICFSSQRAKISPVKASLRGTAVWIQDTGQRGARQNCRGQPQDSCVIGFLKDGNKGEVGQSQEAAALLLQIVDGDTTVGSPYYGPRVSSTSCWRSCATASLARFNGHVILSALPRTSTSRSNKSPSPCFRAASRTCATSSRQSFQRPQTGSSSRRLMRLSRICCQIEIAMA